MFDAVDTMLAENKYIGTWGTAYDDAYTLLFVWPEGAGVVQWKDGDDILSAQEAVFRNTMVNTGIPWIIVRSISEVELFLKEHGGLA